MAELSGAQDPGAVTITLWLSVVVLAFALPILLVLAESRLDRRRLAGEAMDATRRHFVTRGRGVTPSSFRQQWYFTGRQRVLRELTAWLARESPDDFRVRVVTGGPGTGKSAVLGRVVTFGHAVLRRDVPAGQVPDEPGLVPPPGSVHCAVHARGRTTDQVAAAIGHDLGRPVRTAEELLTAVPRDATRPVYGIVVDAIDEAQDPEQLISDLLEPLAAGAAAWRLCLLLGMRTGPDRTLLRRCGPHAVELPLEAPAYFEQVDLAEYGRRCLTAEDEPGVSSPYRDEPELADRVAGALARRAGTNFLVVQLTCLTLAALPQATDDSPEQFPDSVDAAMERYLAAFGDERRRVRDLLVPLAFAEGAGLSDPVVWAALATELGTDRYTAQDVAWLLGERRAVHLLDVTDRTFRLFHEALREHLRGLVTARMDVRAAHRVVMRTLIRHVPAQADGSGPDWLSAGEYVRLHLAAHASAAREITGLLTDPLFLVATDPDQVIGYLPVYDRTEGPPTAAIQAVIDVVQRAGRMLFVHEDGERAAYLQMAARKLGADDLADELGALPLRLPWSVPWARWHAITGGSGLIGSQAHPVRGVAVGAGLIVAHSESRISAWRITPEQIMPVFLPEPRPPARWAAPVPGGIVILGNDGSMSRYDLDSRGVEPWTPRAEVDRPNYCAPMAYRGRDFLLLAGAETARLWDPQRAEPAGPLLRLPAGSRPLAAAVVVDRPLLLVDRHGTVETLDLLAGTRYGVPFQAFEDGIADPDGPVWSGALGEAGGRAVAVLGGRLDRPIIRRDILTGRGVGDDLTGPGIGTTALTIGGGLLWAGGGDGRLRLWTWPDGRPVAQEIAAHEGGVAGVATLSLSGGPVAATCGGDGATRIWYPGGTTETRHGFGVGQLLPIPVDGQERLLASTGEHLLLLDPANGHTVAARPAPCEDLSPMARNPGPGPEDLALAMADGSVHLIKVATLETRRRFTACEPRQISALGTAPGRIMVMTRTGLLQIWDPDQLRQELATVDVGGLVRSVASIGNVAVVPGGNRITTVDLDKGELCAGKLADGCRSGTDIWRISTGRIGGRTVAVGVGAQAHVHVWDAADGTLLADTTLDDGHGLRLSDVVVTRLHDRPVVVTGSYGGAIAIWDLDGRVGEVIEIGPAVWSVAVVGGDTIMAGGPSGLIAIRVTPSMIRTDRPRRNLGIRTTR
ncbi:WD40 repeat domain-containing protein [Actinoplanes sp. L3-i22]|uniref:WD40 repeat domain-containing protein n=1 Tax=Actinoplanes sp. L3-i22 TaxID=2836373 RepID=UPI001C8666FA|nr:WD40 repeat domain-containing protein [Actinoplanes sp. L3-i22]